MKCPGWNDENWDTLVFAIQEQNCILMLGPDTAIEEVDGQSRPCTETLAAELAEKIGQDFESWKIDTSNLAQVSLCYSMRKGRNDLLARVKRFYYARRELTTAVHEDLAALPFYLIVTSTPDNMICNALKESEKEPTIAGYNFKGQTPRNEQIGTFEKPLVFYLCGTIDEYQSLALTENDLLDFLVSVVSKNPPLPNYVLSELRNKDKTLLFLGFGFRHWYLRILLHVLKVGSKESRSFALEPFTPRHLDEYQSTIIFFSESDYKIQICHAPLGSFVKELRRRYEEISSEKPSKDTSADFQAQNAPTIFICHAGEDKDQASYLYEQLKIAGLKPWLDKENIRGGDNWDRLIEKTIEKEIDYFVILQSQALAKKLEGYVNKELNLALRRQSYFRPPLRFVIPVTIEECDPLEDYEHLQSIDLSHGKNFDQLVQTIKRDQERRRR